jgi:hypothetical protein
MRSLAECALVDENSRIGRPYCTFGAATGARRAMAGRTARARAQILSLAQSRLARHPDLDRLAAGVADGGSDPYQAAARLLGAMELP